KREIILRKREIVSFKAFKLNIVILVIPTYGIIGVILHRHTEGEERLLLLHFLVFLNDSKKCGFVTDETTDDFRINKHFLIDKLIKAEIGISAVTIPPLSIERMNRNGVITFIFEKKRHRGLHFVLHVKSIH